MAADPKVDYRPQKSSRPTPYGEETIMDLIIRFTSDEGGTAALEYAIVMTLIGIFLMAGMSALSTTLTGIFNNISGRITSP